MTRQPIDARRAGSVHSFTDGREPEHPPLERGFDAPPPEALPAAALLIAASINCPCQCHNSRMAWSVSISSGLTGRFFDGMLCPLGAAGHISAGP